jgi:hypothetical protein
MHFFYPPLDWRIRDAVLADLSHAALPIQYDVAGTPYTLRAPLGMYMLPALFGRFFGLFAAHAALWAQNGILLGSILYLFERMGRGVAQVAIMLLYACVVVSVVALFYEVGTHLKIASLAERLAEIGAFGLDSWHPLWQFSGSIVQFFWVPNHALPGWWLAALLILHARGQADSATVAASVASALFWSPLAILPAAAWLIFSSLVEPRRHLANWRIWIAIFSGLCFLPLAAFLVTATASIDHGVGGGDNAMFLPLYAAFLVAQLIQARFVYEHRALAPKELWRLFLFSVAFLCALPLFKFGPFNDLVMRASIPALVVIAFVFGAVATQPLALGRRAFLTGCALVAAAAPSALFEISRAATHPSFAISDCSLAEANRELGDTGAPGNYMTQNGAIPAWLMDLNTSEIKVSQIRRCWEDQRR